MLMRQEDWDIHKWSLEWDNSMYDYAVGQGVGTIRGIAVALAAQGEDSVANELLDAVQYIDCGYMRQKRIPQIEKQVKEEKAKYSFFQSENAKNELSKRTEEEMDSLLEKMIEKKSVPTDTNIFKGSVSAS